MESPIKLGISSCLLGEKVRYDGGHKLDHYLTDTLGQFVQWVPVCPEVEYGLPIPREAMRLVGDPEDPRLVTNRTGIDHTEGMRTWARTRLAALEGEDLCGFIFKSRSPSSGLKSVKVYTEAGMPSHRGIGIFARAFVERFPLVPVEDDGRLNDPGLRENFIERIFVFKRWKQFDAGDTGIAGLVDFHSDHKLLIMAHSPKHLKDLGTLVAEAKKLKMAALKSLYFQTLMDALRYLSTVKKNVNVLHHMMGYFKEVLSADEKQELLAVIDRYHRNLVPLVVPVTLINHYARKYSEPYLKRQHYLNPHPVELMLRNHV